MLHQTSGRWQLGFALAMTTAILWGVLPIALKVALQAVDVYTVIWFRFLVSFGLLALFLAVRGQLPEIQKLRSARLDLLAIATIFLALNYLGFMEGLHQTSPTNSQVIIQTAPVFFGMGALWIFKERYTLQQWLGLGGLILGMTLFFDDQLRSLATASTQYLLGTGILVAAAAVWAVYALAQKQLLQQLSSSVIMLVIYGGSALLFTPFASPEQLLNLTPLQWGMLVFSAFNTFLAYGAFAEALDHWEASRVSAVLSMTPIITLISVSVGAAIAPAIVAREPITLLGITGAMFVVLGSLAIALGRRTPQQLKPNH
ncbi:DMT family transporter [Oscillatoria sp. FACHB-1407]|uniref:DMT family transporter n=1 Tax=Oscillatoria sp. FACHB-1407 TaxID=2692847 RepID=UPI001683EDA0|nr:DMT family transporter [Oscillatoria sp. FACHB-1407]MBD2462327.1 DMT family transporter [Oscillatoria sp. FACHB-1407]